MYSSSHHSILESSLCNGRQRWRLTSSKAPRLCVEEEASTLCFRMVLGLISPGKYERVIEPHPHAISQLLQNFYDFMFCMVYYNVIKVLQSIKFCRKIRKS